MLDIKLKDDENFILEKNNVLIEHRNNKRLYDVVLTDKRLMIYLTDTNYDPTASALALLKVIGNNLFKEMYTSLNLADLREIIIYDEEINNYLEKI